ncbi:MAG: hypothetical protein ACMUIU_08410 [bacterium]
MLSNSNAFYNQKEENWNQGDVVLTIKFNEIKSGIAVLLTPQCDIYHNKADFFLFILTIDFLHSFRRIIDPNDKLLDEDHFNGITELSKNKLDSVIKNLLRNLTGSSSPRFYYLPPYDKFGIKFGPYYLDFQRILTVPIENLNEWEKNRVTTIANPFRSQIFSRYISYIGRIGTPDYTSKELYQILKCSRLRFLDKDFYDICDKKFK